MIPIDVSALQNWPDPDAITASADRIASLGKAFHEHLETGHSRWQGLAACYETPHQERMYSALDPALEDGANVKEACGNIKSAMIEFAESIRTLISKRDSLISQAQDYNASPEASSLVPFNGRSNFFSVEQRNIKADIEKLAGKYRNAIETCSSALSAIREDGTSSSDSSSFLRTPLNFGIPATRTLLEARAKDGTLYVSSLHLLIKGQTYKFTMANAILKGRHARAPFPSTMRHGKAYFKPWFDKGARTPFLTGLRSEFLGPQPGKVSPRAVVHRSSVLPSGKTWTLENQHTTRVLESGTRGVVRIGGRVLFVGGVWLTWDSEYDKVHKRLLEEEPRLTEAERGSKARKLATVRTGGQVLATATMSAVIGSMVPVGGTIVGLVIGVGVGLAMEIRLPFTDMTLGEGVAEASEWLWNKGEDFVNWLTSDDTGDTFLSAVQQKLEGKPTVCLAVTKD